MELHFVQETTLRLPANSSEHHASLCAPRYQMGGYPGETETVREAAGMEFVESQYANKTRMPLHSHPFSLMHIVLEGSVASVSECVAETAAVGQVAFLPADAPHEIHWRHPGKAFAINWGAEKACEWLAWGMLPRHPVTLSPGLVSGLLLAVRRECFSGDLAGVIEAESYLAEAVAELLRLPHLDGNRERTSRRLWQAREILHDTYETSPTLMDIARQVEVHPVYLARAFRHAFGETVGECIRRRRIEAGCRLITCSNLSLSEIALEVGFADQSHFTRTFKKCLGVPPSEYERVVRPAKIVWKG